FFFFSSRRRHTRSYGDWSSDVCSSDLASGATYSSSSSPRRSWRSTWPRSVSPSVELNSAALKPRRSSASTWSFMSEISGDTTRKSGRASCRERVEIAEREEGVKKKEKK